MRRALLIAFAGLAVAACSGDADFPLGGPHGGTGSMPPSPGALDSEADGGTVNPSTSGKDGGTPDGATLPTDAGAVTFSSIFKSYLAGGTKGDCTPCHAQMSDAPRSYAWLQQRGYINGKSSRLVSASSSCLSWYGGNMPPKGPTGAQLPAAVADMNAWAAAGAPNN